MSTSSRLVSAFFTSLPAFAFLTMFLASSLVGREYYWSAYLGTLIVLVISCLLFGFMFPSLLRHLRLRQPWMWILAQGLLAWALALFVLGVLNMTPLCVGQENGDGNNSFGMCMGYTVLASIVYTPVFFSTQVVSAIAGHSALKSQHGIAQDK